LQLELLLQKLLQTGKISSSSADTRDPVDSELSVANQDSFNLAEEMMMTAGHKTNLDNTDVSLQVPIINDDGSINNIRYVWIMNYHV